MKDKRHLVRVPGVAKDFYIYKTRQRPVYHLRFTPPRWMQEKLGIGPDRIVRSCETPEVVLARARAEEILRSFFAGDGARAEEMKLRHERVASLGEIVEAYRKGARTIPDKEELLESTINGNINRFWQLVGSGACNGRKRRADEFGHLDASCLTSELIEAFKQRQIAPHLDNPEELELKKGSVNSTIGQARSIFSKDYMPLYAHLNLPDLSGFMGVKKFKVPRHLSRYVPIPQEKIDAMEFEIRKSEVGSRNGDLTELTLEQRKLRGMYLAFYFMLWLGMRQKEVREARLEWVEQWPNQVRMSIVKRAYFKPKGIPGAVAMAPSLLADIKELSGARVGLDYLIPAGTETERHDVLRYDLSRLVRRHLGDDRTKTCHELRKHAISMQLMRLGNNNWAKLLEFSRHSDVRTLMDHYAGVLDDGLPPITSSNWRAA